MIKFYLSTVIIWFIIIMSNHIVFHKQFIKSRELIRKATNDNSKKWGYIKTTFVYLLVSFIPIIRLFELISYHMMIANPEEMVKIIKEREKNNETKN